MTTPATGYLNITDTVTALSVDFLLDPDWRPEMQEVGQKYYPLGNSFATKSTDGMKGLDGTFPLVITSDAQEANLELLLKNQNVLLLTMPNGNTYGVTTDPSLKPVATSKFSQLLWQPITVWTVKFFQVS